jgi:hypothetical protein
VTGPSPQARPAPGPLGRWWGQAGGATWGAGLATALVACTAARIAAAGTSGRAAAPPAQWRPARVLRVGAMGPGPGPGGLTGALAWANGGGGLAVASDGQLDVWRLAGPCARGDATELIAYHLGTLEFSRREAVGIIQRKRSFGVVIFVDGENGARPQLVVDWYARKGPRFLRWYRIHLGRVRNSGVQVAAPSDGDWFATVPVRALHGVRIHIWNDSDGGRFPVRLPPLRRRFSSAFCGGRRNELAWATPGVGIYVAHWNPARPQRVVVDRVAVSRRWFWQGPPPAYEHGKGYAAYFAREHAPPERFWEGALSAGGTHMLLLGWRASHDGLGRFSVVTRDTAGPDDARRLNYRLPGQFLIADPPGYLAAPAFCPAGRLAAFAVAGLLSRPPHPRLGTDLFLVGVPGLRVVQWARVPGSIPLGLSFSPDGRKLALVAEDKIFVFTVGSSGRGSPLWGLPLSAVQRLTPSPRTARPVRSAHGVPRSGVAR